MRRSNFMYFDILSGCYFYDFAWFCAANICVYFQYLFMHCVCANIFVAIVLKLRFKIDVVVMIIWSIVIIINSVLTLQVSTASLPHHCEPCEIKVVSNHTCSLHTCDCAGSRRVHVRLSGFRRQGISSTPRGLLKCPIPVRVCAEHDFSIWCVSGSCYSSMQCKSATLVRAFRPSKQVKRHHICALLPILRFL